MIGGDHYGDYNYIAGFDNSIGNCKVHKKITAPPAKDSGYFFNIASFG